MHARAYNCSAHQRQVPAPLLWHPSKLAGASKPQRPPIPLHPRTCRHAAVALAQEIQAANTALKARVLAAGQHPGVEEEELPTVAALLQSLVVGLLDLFTLEAHGDADLALRITAAGVVSVDGGSLALSMWPKSVAGSTKHHICLMRVVINLEHMAILDEGHKQSLEVLRATTFRPEAILTALRRLLPGQDPPGEGKSGSSCRSTYTDCSSSAVACRSRFRQGGQKPLFPLHNPP